MNLSNCQRAAEKSGRNFYAEKKDSLKVFWADPNIVIFGGINKRGGN